jgi:nitroreductase
MTRTAPTEHPIADVLAARWSPRAFSSRPLSDGAVHSLFEAARWAPSRSNAQPWSFMVGIRDRDDGDHKQLASVLTERNRRWAALAPVLALGIAKVHDGERALPHGPYDLGQAVGALVVQAGVLGLYVHQMAGFDRAAARREFDIPEDHEPMAAMAIGYLGDPDDLPEDLREREGAPRRRKPLSAFVFGGRFGRAAELVEPPG